VKPVAETREAFMRWRSGQAAAAARQRELLARQGARPEQAVAEALAALDALQAMGQWPGPRDPISERAVAVVRERWARIGTHARQAAQSRIE
jgi:hypothetical protein